MKEWTSVMAASDVSKILPLRPRIELKVSAVCSILLLSDLCKTDYHILVPNDLDPVTFGVFSICCAPYMWKNYS